MVNDESLWLSNASVRLELLPLGATIRRFEVLAADGQWRNIVLGAAELAEYHESARYVGMTVGRFANRISGARFTLDGQEFVLDANEGENQLHGGTGGCHIHRWAIAGQGADWVEFRLVSPDGDQGFPGELTLSARYELIPGGAQVTYQATTDAPTVVNLTTHPYFNLNGEASGDVLGHELTIHASSYTPNHPDGIPTGEVRSVAGSAADFRRGQILGEAIRAANEEAITRNGGFDHNFVIDGTGLREHCRLSVPDLTLRIESDEPALQVYGGDHFDGSQIGTSGTAYRRAQGVALETQHYPDSPNQPHFPSTVLRPGQTYQAITRWLVSPS